MLGFTTTINLKTREVKTTFGHELMAALVERTEEDSLDVAAAPRRSTYLDRPGQRQVQRIEQQIHSIHIAENGFAKVTWLDGGELEFPVSELS